MIQSLLLLSPTWLSGKDSVLSLGGRDLGVAFQNHRGSQASSRGEAKDSTLLSSRDGYLLEPTEWPKGSQASCGFRVDFL